MIKSWSVGVNEDMYGEDYYEILDISRSAGQDEIRKAFKKLAIIYHPDKNTDDPDAHDKFVRLTKAYETLKDNDLRKTYDLFGEDGFKKSNKQTYYSSSYYQHSFIYQYDENVVYLTKNDYFESIINSDSSWFVNFYSPMCSHCHHLAPVWRKVAKLLNSVMKIAAVNCEYDRMLCHQVGIHVYPTLLYFNKHSQNGVHYNQERTQQAIIRFALNKLNIQVPEINESQWELFLRGKNIVQRPMLIFICGIQRNCFTSNERLIVGATFDKLIDVRMFTCESDSCHDKISHNIYAVYLPTYNISFWEPIFFNSISDIKTLIEELSSQLPNPQELSDNDFEHIRKAKSNVIWLICFYFDDVSLLDLNLQIKKLSTSINIGKINCDRYRDLCSKLSSKVNVLSYPMWGVIKPGGTFELNHGKNMKNDILKFTQFSMKATNFRTLFVEEASSILQKGDEAWFLNWFTPQYPLCIEFLLELRKASLEFDPSKIRFGTIDCTVHTTLCRQYNIQYYPTSMLINGSDIHQFTSKMTATYVIQLIREKINPSVIELTSKNFNHKLAMKTSKVMWIVDYFVSWCGPCQKLAPEWITVAKSLNNLSFVKVASVNCETEASLCQSQGVRSYPNIRLYPLGSEGLSTVALYNGQRDSLSILTWITMFFPKKVYDLQSSNYRESLGSKHIWIINFYLPRCWYCQKMEPEFAIAAQV
ncbi:hypothetical protein P5V15_012493 [Pogonomyrmex californicus]